MKLFWTIILSAMVGIGPIMPQIAFAQPLGGADKPVDPTNSFEIVELEPDENKSLKVLFINVREKENPKKTLRNVQKNMEDAVREHPDLRFVNITVHPPEVETEHGEKRNAELSYLFRLPNADHIVAKKIGTSKMGMYSYTHMESDFNHDQQTHVTNKIMDYSNRHNPNLYGSESFLKALTHTDVNEMNFKRPRTDITTALIRFGATAFGVSFAAYAGADATALQAIETAALPAGVAFLAGIKNQGLLDWEQKSETGRITKWATQKLSLKNKERAESFLKEIKSWGKNSLLATGYVATLHISMLLTGMMQEPMALETFAAGVAAGTFRNIYKKTLLIRALNKWTHKKYETNPRNAAKYARIHAWTMAIIGAIVTGSDSLQALDASEHPLAHSVSHWIDGAMIAAGGAGLLFRTKIEWAYKKARSKCSSLFTRGDLEP